jgi:outer membrane protein TolC
MKRKRVLPLCLGALFACASARSQERPSITLEDLVRTSLARNRELLALCQRVAQAQALARQAGIRPAPTLQAERVSGRPLGSSGEEQFSAAFLQPVETIGKRKDRIRVAELALRRLTGMALADALPTSGPPTGGKAALSLEQSIARALEKRADLRAARLLEEQGGAETTLAKAQARPDVTFSARYVRNNTRFENQYGFTSAGALTALREQYNTLSVGVSVPLMTQRRSRGAIEAAASGAAIDRLRREYLESSIPLEVQSAYERWTAAVRTRNLLRDGVVGQSNKNLAVIREAYQLGQLRLLDVLSEQRRMTDTDLSYLDARMQMARALADLERVTGGLLP